VSRGASAAACVLALLLAGCGDRRVAPASGEQAAAPAADERCGSITVPGHRAEGIVATAGIGCSVAVDVAADATGRGYLSTGFSCRPAATTGGRTAYACTQGGRRITFRLRAR
jgi:hypothetical protein